MAPKDAKKRMTAGQNKECKLQTTTESTPCKTVSNCAPSLHRKCSMHIKNFVGANSANNLSTYLRVVTSIIVIILVSNQKP